MKFDGMRMKYCTTCSLDTLHRISGGEVYCLRCDIDDALYDIFKKTWDNRNIN